MAKIAYAVRTERQRRTSRIARYRATVALLVALSILAAISGSISAISDQIVPPMKFGIPAYAYPTDRTMWSALAALPPGSTIILDPADGPGKAMDPTYQRALAPVRERGVKILGYIDTAFGTRDVSTILEEAKAYEAWYQPDGIFLDQTPGDASFLPAFRTIIVGLRSQGYQVVLNPGQPKIAPEYVDLADHVINFEGTWASYQKFRVPRWVRTFPRDKFWHLVHETGDAATMRRAVRFALQRHAGTVYVTDATMPNPWNRLPVYWREETGLVGALAASSETPRAR
jgi:hypothetical protein